MFLSLAYMDLSWDVLLEEISSVILIFRGGYRYKDLIEMPIDKYEKILKLAKEVNDG